MQCTAGKDRKPLGPAKAASNGSNKIDGSSKKELLKQCREHKLRVKDLPDELQEEAFVERRQEVEVPAKISLRVETYGMLCAAAVVHGVSDWQEMLETFVEANITEWMNDDFFMVDALLPEGSIGN